MAQRGRKSAAALSVVSPDGVQMVRRPEPPGDLTDEQAHEWRCIVNDLRADHFSPKNLPLLASYCRHIVTLRRVSQLIAAAEDADPFDIDEYDKLLKMQEREGRALSSLATRMRLSQQAVSSADKSQGGGGSRRKPWQLDAD